VLVSVITMRLGQWGTLVVAAALIAACGGQRTDSGGGGMVSGSGGGGMVSGSGGGGVVSGSDSGSTSGGATSASAGGGPQWTDAGPPAQIVCTTQGQRRDATAEENAQYCVCEPVSQVEGTQTTTWLLWSCYGPSPSTPKPSPTTCTFTDVNPGSGDGSCWVNWSSCSNGKNYSFSCVDHYCKCLVQGASTTVFVEPRNSCPEDKASLNALCGWNLQ
jgi:hypothetical protein